jgi:toxin ParE1/3/4
VATYRFSLSAEGDLEGILAYSIDEWGIEQTARYRDQLLGCCQLIAQQTMLGRSCDDIRPGYLRIQEGRHVLFFKRDAAGVLVVRILHDCMNPFRHIEDDDEDE